MADETSYTTAKIGSENEEHGGDTAKTVAVLVVVLVVLGVGVGVGYWCITRRKSEETDFEVTVEQKTYSAIPINGINVDDCPE